MERKVGPVVIVGLLACGGATTPDGGTDASDAANEKAVDAAGHAVDVAVDAAPSPVVLVSNAGTARSIAVDSTTLYWAAGDVISTCAKTACSPPFAQPNYNQSGADNLALDGAYLYWTTTSGNVARCATDSVCGNGPTVLMTVQYGMTSLVIRSGNAYWNTLHAIITCDVTSIATCQSTMHTIASGAIQPEKLAVDDTNVYWSDIGTGGTSGAKVFACPIAGCATPTALVTGVPQVGEIALSSTSVYWRMTTKTSGALVACAKTGCSGVPTTVGVSAPIGGVPLLIDGANAYWSTANSEIVRCNGLSCLNGADVIAEQQATFAMVADDTSLYWVGPSGTISMLTPK